MWLAKLKLYHNDCPIVNRCVKFNVCVLSYPKNYFIKNKKKHATTICKLVSDNEKQKQRFLDDLKKDKHILRLDIFGDSFVYEYDLGTEGEHVMLYFDPEIILTKPTINSSDGFEYWEVSSWSKEKITHFVKELEKHMDKYQVLSISKTDNLEVYFPNVIPKLSKSQEKALLLAYKNNYYTYPRTIELRDLAKKSKLSLSTYQENLRKAENKLMPILIDRFIIPETKPKLKTY